MKNIDIRIKIVVGVKEDGTDDVREVSIEQAIAFVKNQLDALEALRKSKGEFDAEKWREGAEDALKEAGKIQPVIPSPWDTQPWSSDSTTWPHPGPPFVTTTSPVLPLTWCSDHSDGVNGSDGSISYNNACSMN
jgi:hypothetical protein